MNFQPAVIVDEAEFAELIHEKAHSGSCRTDDLGEGFLAHLWNYLLGLAVFSKVSQEEQDARESFLAGVEELVHKVLFDANVAGEDVSKKEFGEFRFVVDHSSCGSFLQPDD